MVFLSKAPNNHLQNKRCPKSYGIVKMTTEDFIQRAKIKHGDKFDYSESILENANTKTKITCNDCKYTFYQRQKTHLYNRPRMGCYKCAGKVPKTHDEWLDIFNKRHGDFYDYSVSGNLNNRRTHEKIDILCPLHGIFNQNVFKHQTQGCRQCDIERIQMLSKREIYENRKTKLYYVRIDEVFYKIGLTLDTVEFRFRCASANIEMLNEWEFDNGLIAFNIEQSVLKNTFQYQITKEESPICGGWTEVRSINIINEIIEEIEAYDVHRKD